MVAVVGLRGREGRRRGGEEGGEEERRGDGMRGRGVEGRRGMEWRRGEVSGGKEMMKKGRREGEERQG